MKFTTPCFVRVENVEERDELVSWCINIGYTCRYCIQRSLLVVVGFDNGYVHTLIDENDDIQKLRTSGCIDCGTDVELFKYLAAMNDENDSEQWFTDGTDWIFSEYTDFDGCMTTAAECEAGNVGYYTFCQEYGYRKATASEIIEHFKSKK